MKIETEYEWKQSTMGCWKMYGIVDGIDMSIASAHEVGSSNYLMVNLTVVRGMSKGTYKDTLDQCREWIKEEIASLEGL